jgi:hypothetical protein
MSESTKLEKLESWFIGKDLILKEKRLKAKSAKLARQIANDLKDINKKQKITLSESVKILNMIKRMRM